MSCKAPHDLAVYARERLPGGDCPGAKQAAGQSEQSCIDEFQDLAGKSFNRSTLGVVYLHPYPPRMAGR